ncbi:SDR family oxidoreductase [Halovenus marina]|uniref:SDR family oxidoreductase n=1 Tax=Halovenus marina TaxID=3396621 RepID=UPI003F56DB0D
MTVVVLGCGYVGIELGRQLSDTHEVIGVRRSQSGTESIEEAGFAGVQADITDAESLEAVPDADAVVFAASSGGRDAEAARAIYVDGQRTAIEHFQSRADPPDRYIYTSSTGVYGDHDGDWVDETTPIDPTTAKTEMLAEAERVALDAEAMDGTVARFAGLYGPGRYRLERYLDGPVTEGYLNMIHRADAAGAVAFLLRNDCARGDVVLVVDDEPVSKWEFADWLADACGVDRPPKQTKAERLSGDVSDTARRRILTSKRCDNERLRSLGYELSYPTFREGYRSAIESFRAGTGP